MKPAESFILANGMKFILAENPNTSAVAVSFWARVGACDEAPGMRGLAHFMEHMMFRGSENVPPEDHSKRIARLGGDSNAYTSADGTVYHETLPPQGLEEAFRLEGDRFRRLLLRPDLVTTEKNVVFEEFRHSENQPLSRAWRLLFERIFGDHPYAVDPLGRREDLVRMSPTDLGDFYRAHYRPSRIFGVISGHFNAREANKLASAHFGDWIPPGSAAIKAEVAPLGPLNGYREEKLSVEVPMVLRLHRLNPAGDEDLPALRVLSAYLTRGESSPLRETLVKKDRACVEAGGMLWTLAHGGLFGLYGSHLHVAGRKKARESLESFSRSLLDQPLDEKRLFAVLKRFRRDRAYDGYSASRRMEGLGEAELTGGGFERYERELEDFGRVDAARIKALIERLLVPGNTLDVDLLPEAA